MNPFATKLNKIILGACAASGVATCYFLGKDDKRVWSSIPFKSGYGQQQVFDPPKSSIKWDDNWDRRAPRSLVEPKVILDEKDDNRLNEELEFYKPKKVRNIILIRHGQYNTRGATDAEKILTKLGRQQAEYTGKRLKELNIPFTMMVRSTMARAQETGAIISQFLPEVPISHCHFIREGMPIGPEPPSRNGWKPEVYYYTDGARIEAAFRKYFHRAELDDEKDSYILMVCHANVIRYFVCRALQFPAEGWLRISLPHASITWISITPSGRCILRCLGDTGHMPPEAVTTR